MWHESYDMTHPYEWRVICCSQHWLLLLCDITQWYDCVAWLMDYVTCRMRNDSSTWVTWHDLFDMSHAYEWRDIWCSQHGLLSVESVNMTHALRSMTHVTWPIHMSDVSWLMWHVLCIWVTCFMHMCDVTSIALSASKRDLACQVCVLHLCSSVLQCVAVSASERDLACQERVLQLCSSVLQCVAVCCSVLQSALQKGTWPVKHVCCNV